MPRNQLPEELKNISYPETVCLSEYIPGCHHQTMTLEQIKQIVVLLTKAKRTFADISSPYNIVYTSEGQIGLIDTEERGFRDNYAKHTLHDFFYSHKLDFQAQEYLKSVLISMGVSMK